MGIERSEFYPVKIRAFRQHHKSGIRTADDFDGPSAGVSDPFDESSGVSGIGPNDPQAGEVERRFRQHSFRSVAILHIGCVNHDREHQPERINEQVPLSTFDLFSRVEAGFPASIGCLHALALAGK